MIESDTAIGPRDGRDIEGLAHEAPWDARQVDWQSIVEQSPDVIMSISRSGTILYINHVVSGLRRDDVLGQPSVNFIAPAERDEYRRSVDHVFATGEPVVFETSGTGPDGSESWYFSSMSPVVQEGEVVAITVIARDITARRLAEAAISEALVRETEAAARLRDLDEMHRDFTAKVVHDLRTPITIIDGFARTLLDELVATSSGQRADYLRLISEASGRLTVLVDAVLDVFRIEANEYQYDIAPSDVGASVLRTIAELGPAGAHIEVELPPTPVAALMDERRHSQVLMNLLSNACKFSPGGSVVVVSVAREGDEVRVSVADQGIGIRREDQDLLFQKFSQVTSLGASPQHGSGLGLYICRSMLEAQAGTISVTSEPGLGSTFTYRLPAVI